MEKCIVYPNSNGGICVIIPSKFCDLSIDKIAKKDVDAGLPYLIIQQDDLPKDNIFRDSWVCDFSEPHGYGIGHDAWFKTINQG